MIASPTGTIFIPVVKTGIVELSNVVTPDDIIISAGEIDDDRMLILSSMGLIRADVSSWPARYQDAFTLAKNKLTIDILGVTQSAFRTEPGNDRTICLVSDVTVHMLTLNEFGKGIGRSIPAQIELWRHMEPTKHLYIVWTNAGHVIPLFIVPDKVDKG